MTYNHYKNIKIRQSMPNNAIFTLTFIFFSFVSISQEQEEYKIHLNSIDATYYPGHIIDRTDTVFNANRAFIDYTIKNFLKNPSDIKYISNRTILPKLKHTICDNVQTKINDTLSSGERVEVLIQTGQFDSTKHTISRYKEKEYSDAIERIDGQFPYGGVYGIPEKEIQIFSIKINGKKT
jgi:spore coat protein CotH